MKKVDNSTKASHMSSHSSGQIEKYKTHFKKLNQEDGEEKVRFNSTISYFKSQQKRVNRKIWAMSACKTGETVFKEEENIIFSRKNPSGKRVNVTALGTVSESTQKKLEEITQEKKKRLTCATDISFS